MPNNSNTVDERVVEMRIDNQKFEAGAKKAISILESLDKSLDGLGSQNAEGLDKVSSSLDVMTKKFSIMGTVGDQIIRNLTNKAMELVGQFHNMATMLTTQQISAGWNKYADKTQAIQTIMAATSGKIDDGTFANQAEQLGWVNDQIEKLNKFTDETSYNFLDMVGNIGKFTAAGRDLEESVIAMEGIANWAAISGGRPAEASRAMYNLSQALGMGKVTQIDWKSIENANMATYEFKQQVIDVAEELGNLEKVGEGVWAIAAGREGAGKMVTVESFREELSQGWFDSNVLLKVLNNYGDFSDKLMTSLDKYSFFDSATPYLKVINAFADAFNDKGLDSAIEVVRQLGYTDSQIQEMLPDLQEFSKAEYELGRRAFQAAQEAKTFSEAIDATKDAVSTKWMDVFERLFGTYLEAKTLWTDLAETLWNIFARPIDHLVEILDVANETYDETATEGIKPFNELLAESGVTMEDFRKAMYAVSDHSMPDIIDACRDVEQAIRDGYFTTEEFTKALEYLDERGAGKKGLKTAAAGFDEYRAAAQSLLNGEHTRDGAVQKQWIEEMGYDYELMMAMVNNIHWFGESISDEYLMTLMEQYYDAQKVGARTGAGSFAEWLKTQNKDLEVSISLIEQQQELMLSVYGAGILDENGHVKGAGEYFRQGLTNIIQFFDDISTAIDNVFLKIFGGSSETEQAIANLGGRFWTVAKGFADFTETFKFTYDEFDEEGNLIAEGSLTKLENVLSLIVIPLKLIANLVGIVFKVAKYGLSLIFPIIGAIGSVLSVVGGTIKDIFLYISESFQNSGIISTLAYFGEIIGGTIVTALYDFSERFGAFIDRIMASEAAATILDGIVIGLEALWSILKLIGLGLLAVFGGAFTVLSTIFNVIKDGVVYLWNLASSSERVQKVFGGLTEKLKAFNRYVNLTVQAVGAAYKRRGFEGAMKSLSAYLEYGLKQILPAGEKFLGFFRNLRDTISGWFRGNEGEETKIQQLSASFNGLWSSINGEEEGTTAESSFKSRFKSIKDTLQNIYDGIFAKPEEIKERTTGFLTGLWNGFLEFIRGIRFGDVIAALRLGVVAPVIVEITSSLVALKRIPEDLVDGLREFIYDAGYTLKGFAASFRADAFIKIAIAAGIMAFAIYKLTQLAQSDTEDKLTHVASIIAMLIAIMGFVANKLNVRNLENINIRQFTLFGSLGGALFGLGIALVGFALAVRMLSKIPPNNLKSIVHILMDLLEVIGIFVIIMTLLLKRNKDMVHFDRIEQIGKTLLNTARAFTIIAFAINLLAIPIITLSIMDWLKFDIWKAFGVITTIAAVILGLTIALTAVLAHNSADKVYAAGGAMLKIGLAILLISAAIAMMTIPLILMAAAQKWVGNVIGIIATIGTLAILIGFFGFLAAAIISNKDSQKLSVAGNLLLKIAGAFAIMALAFTLLAAPIYIMSMIAAFGGGKALRASAGVIIGILAVIGLVLGFIAKRFAGDILVNEEKISAAGNMMLKLAGAIAIIGLATLLMMPALTAIAGAVAGIMAISQKSSTGEGRQLKWWEIAGLVLALIGAAVVAIGLGLAVGILGAGILIFGAAIIALAVGIKMIDAVFPVMVETFTKMKEVIFDNGGWKSLALGVVALLAFVAALALLVKLFAWLTNIKGLKDTFKVIRVELVKGIKSIGTSVKTGATGMWNNIMDFMKDPKNVATITGILTNLIVIIGLYLVGIIPTLADTVTGAIVELIFAISNSMVKYHNQLVAGLTQIMHEIFKLISDITSTLFSAEFSEDLNWFARILRDLAAIKFAANMFEPFKGLAKILTGVGGKAGLLSSTQGLLTSLGGIEALGPIGVVITIGVIWHHIVKERDEWFENALEEAGLGADQSVDALIVETEKLQSTMDKLTELRNEILGASADQLENIVSDDFIEKYHDEIQLLADEASIIEKREVTFDEAVERLRKYGNITGKDDDISGGLTDFGINDRLIWGYQRIADLVGLTEEELEEQTKAVGGDIRKVKAVQDYLAKQQQMIQEAEDAMAAINAVANGDAENASGVSAVIDENNMGAAVAAGVESSYRSSNVAANVAASTESNKNMEVLLEDVKGEVGQLIGIFGDGFAVNIDGDTTVGALAPKMGQTLNGIFGRLVGYAGRANS